MSMTESEALAELKTFPINCLDFKENQALQIAIDLLEQYRAIGTVSDFRELKEKATEIRAKAITKFAEVLKHRCYVSNAQCEMNYIMPWEIDEIAKKLKGEPG